MNCPRCKKEMEEDLGKVYSNYICKCDPLCTPLLYTVMITIRNFDKVITFASIYLYFTKTSKANITIYPSRYDLYLEDNLMVREHVEETTLDAGWEMLKRFSKLLAFT
jgi:hypothetical protein